MIFVYFEHFLYIYVFYEYIAPPLPHLGVSRYYNSH